LIVQVLVSWESNQGSTVVLIHVFCMVLDNTMTTFAPWTPVHGGQRPKLRAKDTVVTLSPLPLDRAWRSRLTVWLPGSWTETAIAKSQFHPAEADIRLNLTGMNHYNPMLPKVTKWRSGLGGVAILQAGYSIWGCTIHLGNFALRHKSKRGPGQAISSRLLLQSSRSQYPRRSGRRVRQ
jgi:hypothetical protein